MIPSLFCFSSGHLVYHPKYLTSLQNPLFNIKVHALLLHLFLNIVLSLIQSLLPETFASDIQSQTFTWGSRHHSKSTTSYETFKISFFRYFHQNNSLLSLTPSVHSLTRSQIASSDNPSNTPTDFSFITSLSLLSHYMSHSS